jgi:tetratricopeptide (TPR) repeat protein
VYLFWFIGSIFFSCSFFSQNIDSLKLELQKDHYDSITCNILSKLAESAPDGEWEVYNDRLKKLAEKNLVLHQSGPLYKLFSIHLASSINNLGYKAELNGDIVRAIGYYEKSLYIAEKIKDKPGTAIAFHNLGALFKNRGEIDKSLRYFGKSMKIAEETGDKKNQAYILHNMGAIFYEQGNIQKALDYYMKSLKLHQSVNERPGEAICLTSIAYVYMILDEMDIAQSNFSKSLQVCEEIGDLEGAATNLDNMGVILMRKKEWKNALVYHEKGMQLRQKNEDKNGLAISHHNISFVYEGMKNYRKALDHLFKSLELYKYLDSEPGMVGVLTNIGRMYFEQKDFTRSIEYAKKGLELADKLAYPADLRNTSELLYKNYKAMNDHDQAYAYYNTFIRMRDSLTNTENKKAAIRNQLRYEYETKAATDSILRSKENEIREEVIARKASEIRAHQNRQYFLYGGIGLFIFCSGFLYNRFRFTQKQKKVIELQKKIVEEKQREVLDSIHYANRIQKALMTTERYIERNLQRLNKW